MIYLLVIVLAFNLYIAYKSFKNIVAPPVLMGCGMLMASIIAASYYDEWNMKQMLFESVLILGGGTLFFTLCCIALNKISPNNKHIKPNISISIFRLKQLKLFYLFAIIFGVFTIFIKIYYMKIGFGPLELSQLIMARRFDNWSGENSFSLPPIVRMAGSFSTVLCYLTIWCLSIQIITKSKDKYLYFLLIGQFLIVLFDGMLNGTKGSIIALPTSFFIVYFFFYYSQKGKFSIKKIFFIKLSIAFILFSFSFKGLNLIIGRDVESAKEADLFAEYCGAQIKNFDIYLHKYPNGNPSINYWGWNTFQAFYKELSPNNAKGPGEFQSVGMFGLGNVYTQYRPYHEDFGFCGVYIMIMVISIITMYFYNKTFKFLTNPTELNICVFIYASMGMSLFMAFFSSRITEGVFTLGYIRQIMYFTILIWFSKKYLIR